MTGTGDLLHRGTKVFWKVRSTCDVVLIKHKAFDLIEVVCFDPIRSRETARLYVKHSVIYDRINEKQFLLKQRVAIENKEEQPDGPGSISSGNEISVVETVNYICDRLHVQSYDPKSRIFQVEILEYLLTEEKRSDSQKLIYSKPASLIPFDIMLTSSKVSSIHSSSAPLLTTAPSKKLAKELTLEIPAEAIEEPAKSHTPKTPKTPVPVIPLDQLLQYSEDSYDHNNGNNAMNTANGHINNANNYDNNSINDPNNNGSDDNNLNTTAPNTTNTINTTNTTDTASPTTTSLAHSTPTQGMPQPPVATVHTADSIEADFHIHHGRRSLNRKPFTPADTSTTTNPYANTANTNTNTGSNVTSPVVSPRVQAGTAYTKQITPRKGGHISVLQATHNTHNSHAAEARHAKQHVHTNHSIVSHYSVGSSHLAPIPVPDQLTKITTHPTLPPHRNLTPHQEPLIPDKIKQKKNKVNTFAGSIASFTSAMYGLFGSSSDVRVAADNNTHAGEVHVLNAHNAIQHVKPGTVANYAYGSSNSLGSSASGGSGSAAIPKHMRTNV